MIPESYPHTLVINYLKNLNNPTLCINILRSFISERREFVKWPNLDKVHGFDKDMTYQKFSILPLLHMIMLFIFKNLAHHALSVAVCTNATIQKVSDRTKFKFTLQNVKQSLLEIPVIFNVPDVSNLFTLNSSF